jgi:hypothetical protein
MLGDGGVPLTPGPVVPGGSAAMPGASAQAQAMPEVAASATGLGVVLGPSVGPGTMLDAGTGDAYAPPLPPLPDGGVADSRLEPRGEPEPASR